MRLFIVFLFKERNRPKICSICSSTLIFIYDDSNLWPFLILQSSCKALSVLSFLSITFWFCSFLFTPIYLIDFGFYTSILFDLNFLSVLKVGHYWFEVFLLYFWDLLKMHLCSHIPSPWRNCLSWGHSLVLGRLGTAGLYNLYEKGLESLFIPYSSKVLLILTLRSLFFSPQIPVISCSMFPIDGINWCASVALQGFCKSNNYCLSYVEVQNSGSLFSLVFHVLCGLVTSGAELTMTIESSVSDHRKHYSKRN